MQVFTRVLGWGLIAIAVACTSSHRATDTTGPSGPVSPGGRPVTLAPAIVTLKVGDTVRFMATVASGTLGVVWSTQDPAKVTVDTTGLARAIAVTTPSLAVCATSTSDAGAKACAAVTVVAP